MPRIRKGCIQDRGTSFRIAYYGCDGQRRYETFKTRDEAESALAQRVSATMDELPVITPRTLQKRKLKSVAHCAGVYFLWCKETSLTKIGQSRGAGRRIADITMATGAQLYLIGFLPSHNHVRAEKFIHEVLKSKRVRGEWFRLTPYDIERAIAEWSIYVFSPKGENRLPLPSSALLEAV